MRQFKLQSFWNQFWFGLRSPLPMACFRILFGLLVLQLGLISIGDDLLNWYGPHSFVSIERVKDSFWSGRPVFDLLLFMHDAQSIRIVFFVFVLAAFMLTIGLFSRFSALIVSVGLISLNNHNPFNINAGDALLRLAAFFLVFSDCGGALSVDILFRSTGKVAGNQLVSFANSWAQRMMQLQLAIVYWDASFSKIISPLWRDGTAIYQSVRFEDITRLQIPFLFDNIWCCKLIAWSTIGIEAALWTLVWIKPLRYWVLLAGVLLHLGIDLVMALPVFEWLMISSFIVFVDPADLERVIAGVKRLVVRLVSPVADLGVVLGKSFPSVRESGLSAMYNRVGSLLFLATLAIVCLALPQMFQMSAIDKGAIQGDSLDNRERTLRRDLELCAGNGEKELPLLAELASVYWQENKLDAADKTYRHIWDLQVKRGPVANQDIADVMLNLAALNRDRGLFGQSEYCYKVALEYDRTCFGKDSPQEVRDLNGLAVSYYMDGQSARSDKERREKQSTARNLMVQCRAILSRVGDSGGQQQCVSQNLALVQRDLSNAR